MFGDGVYDALYDLGNDGQTLLVGTCCFGEGWGLTKSYLIRVADGHILTRLDDVFGSLAYSSRQAMLASTTIFWHYGWPEEYRPGAQLWRLDTGEWTSVERVSGF